MNNIQTTATGLCAVQILKHYGTTYSVPYSPGGLTGPRYSLIWLRRCKQPLLNGVRHGWHDWKWRTIKTAGHEIDGPMCRAWQQILHVHYNEV